MFCKTPASGSASRRSIATAVACLMMCSGCCGPSFNSRATRGIIIYTHGAGNVDFGHTSIREGFEEAGFRGQFFSCIWTSSFVAPIDQVVRPWIRSRSYRLARTIEAYIDRYPGRPIHLVGLSAGSAVALWAVEGLRRGYQVDNVVMLSSSLSHDYDVRPALRHIKGKIYNFFWPGDPILGQIVSGGFFTIDGKFREQSAGLTGLAAADSTDRVVNIRWKPTSQTIRNYRGHTDNTRTGFIRSRVAPLLLNPQSAAPRERTPATEPETTPPDAPADQRPPDETR